MEDDYGFESSTGFSCPKCGSWDNEYIFGSTSIECNNCRNIWDPGEPED